MKKNKAKKILVAVCLGLVGMGCLTGCSMTEEQQSALDKAVNKADEAVEVLTKMNNKLTKEELLDVLKDKAHNLMKSATKQNLTVTYKEGNTINRSVRIEYVSEELTKLYIYSTDNEGVINKEVYKEITPTTVTTYVNDGTKKLYSEVPMNLARSENSLLSFDEEVDVAMKNASETIKWKDVCSVYFGTSKDEIEMLCDIYSSIMPMTTSSLESIGAKITYENDIITLSRKSVEYAQQDKYDDDSFEYSETIITLSNQSLTEKTNSSTNNLGKPGVSSETSESSYVFDEINQNRINFNKTGYILVSDYLN